MKTSASALSRVNERSAWLPRCLRSQPCGPPRRIERHFFFTAGAWPQSDFIQKLPWGQKIRLRQAGVRRPCSAPVMAPSARRAAAARGTEACAHFYCIAALMSAVLGKKLDDHRAGQYQAHAEQGGHPGARPDMGPARGVPEGARSRECRSNPRFQYVVSLSMFPR